MRIVREAEAEMVNDGKVHIAIGNDESLFVGSFIAVNRMTSKALVSLQALCSRIGTCLKHPWNCNSAASKIDDAGPDIRDSK